MFQQVAVLGLLGLFQLGLLAQSYYQIGDHFSFWHPLALTILYWFVAHYEPEHGQYEAPAWEV